MYKRIKRHYNFLLGNTHVICILSSSFLPILRQINPLLLEKTIVINNPNTYKDIENNPIKENIVLCVAGLQNKQKNISGLIDIWKNIKNNNWVLDIVGDGRPIISRKISGRMQQY